MAARLAAALTAVILFAFPLQTAAAVEVTHPDDWYLSVGPACGTNNPVAQEPWCGPFLVVRDPAYHLADDLVWPSNSLTGPNGPVPLSLSSRAYDGQWSGWAPATGYTGNAYYNKAGSGLPPGRYTYRLTVDISGQWSCSKYNPKGCSWFAGDKVRYEWTFDWDGVNTVTVAPTWKLDVQPQKLCGTKGCAAVVTYIANVAMLTPIEVQRRSAGKPWKTIETDKVIGYNGWIFDDTAKPGTTYQYRLRTTDPSHQTSKPAKLRF